MTIWILTLVLFGVPALLGFFIGGIQTGFIFAAAVLALFLALPLGAAIKPLFTLCGLSNPVWLLVWPPVAIFLLLQIIAWVAGYLVHKKIFLHHRHISDEFQMNQWRRMNSRLGVCLGLAIGSIHLLAAAAGVYGMGYLTVQLASAEKDPIWLQFINKFRTDMRSSGLDRIVAGLDPMPKDFYPISDILGLLYQNNPAINKHVSEYPPFFTLADRQDVKEIIEDNDFMDALKQKISAAELIRHPRFLNIIGNVDLTQQFLQLDLKDVREFLEKGKSPQYDPLVLLGYWDLDVDQSLITIKKTNPDISSKQLMEIKRTLATMSDGSFLKANIDHRLALTLKGRILDFSSVVIARNVISAPAAPAAPPRNTRGLGVAPSALAPAVRQRFSTAPSSLPPEYATRYPQMAQQQQFQQQQYAAAQAAVPQPETGLNPDGTTNAPTVRVNAKVYEGTWQGEGETYTVKVKGEGNQEYVSEVLIEAEQMTLNFANKPLIFVKRIL